MEVAFDYPCSVAWARSQPNPSGQLVSFLTLVHTRMFLPKMMMNMNTIHTIHIRIHMDHPFLKSTEVEYIVLKKRKSGA